MTTHKPTGGTSYPSGTTYPSNQYYTDDDYAKMIAASLNKSNQGIVITNVVVIVIINVVVIVIINVFGIVITKLL